MHPSRAHRLIRSTATRGRALVGRRPLTTHHSPLTRRTAAFTLVELLVALTILAILSALVITAMDQDDGDRMSESTRVFHAYLEGARSRAVENQHPYGVRLIVSQNDPRVVDSLVYVAAGEEITGTLNIAHDGNTNEWFLENTNGALEWARLNMGGRQLIERGNRIEVPRGSARWYAINGFDPMTGLIRIAGHYTPSVWVAGTPPYYQPLPDPDGDGVAVGVPYRMELSPTTAAGADPIQLEPGVVIDLDASRIPASWRPDAMSPQPNAYTQRMEVMFDARGNITGDLVASGLVHFFLANVADVELSRARPMHPSNQPYPMPGSNRYPFTRDSPDVDPRVVTLFTQTGQVMTSQAGLQDLNGDGRADPGVLFEFAQYGREAAQ